MNRSRKIEGDETQDPASHAPERRASSGLSREHGKNDLFEPNVRVPGRYPSFTDGFQPLDISDDSDDGAFDSELPTTITTRQDKKSVAFNDYKGTLKDRRDVYYPSMSEQRRPSREPQDDNNIDIHSHAWVSTSPPPSPKRSASPEPSWDHAGALPYKRAHFERQPSKSYVIPRENDATVFDLWETDAQGNSQQKEPLHLASTEETSADNALNNLYAQVNEDLRYKDQETQDSLEGYKGDLADALSKQKALQDQLQAADAKVAHLTKQLRDMRGSAHKDFQDVQQALDKVKNMAASKAAYKDKYRQEYDAHMVTRENIKDLQVQLQRAQALALKPARRARAGLSPPDSSDSDDDIPPPAVSRRRQRSTQPPVGAQSDNDDYDHRRHPRPKKPEPESFSGNGTTSADYLKWKMAIADWFAYYPYEFASEAMKLSYIRQKTKDQAFGCLQHGYLEPGAEFVHSDEVWSILDSVYKSLNTSIEAQSWYESSKSTMKPAESMGEYIARFNVGTSALRWNDTLKIQFMRHRLPVWWRDMTAMKVLEADITYLGFCQTLRLLEQSNPPRTTTTGNRSAGGAGGGGGGGNKSTPSNTNRNNGSGSGPRGRSDIQVKVLRHLNLQDALEKAIANNGVPVGEPARPKIKGAAAGVTSTSNSSPPSENA
ncbi:hypothetical protein PTMSG1_10531 [Pyrenophora teres f. maculata]|nr:hypothetical protein PTMSG1_10531 [Pyrenophora teres f. maculata]